MLKRKIAESKSKRGQALVINGWQDWLAVFVATGGGAGMVPFGPGTWGSIVGLLIAYGLTDVFADNVIWLQNSIILVSVFLAAIGIWAGSRAETIFQQKDAGQVVIDEVCGQVMSFAFIAPFVAQLGQRWRWWMIAGFAFFRLFDIFKPYPINRLQDLHGGFGVMMDDVLAGIYAAALLSLLMTLAV